MFSYEIAGLSRMEERVRNSERQNQLLFASNRLPMRIFSHTVRTICTLGAMLSVARVVSRVMPIQEILRLLCTCSLLFSLILVEPHLAAALDPTRQIDQYAHETWTSQHGLPGQAVYQILQSPDGYLWLRTSAGLARFDGVRFVLMNQALGTELVKAISIGASGDLLIRTTSKTVQYRDGAFADYLPPVPLPIGEIRSIFETKDRRFLIGTDSDLYNQQRDGIRLIQGGTAWISAFLEDSNGTVWVGGGTDLYSYKNGTFRTAYKMGKLGGVFTLIQDRHQTIWAGTSTGIFRLRGREGISLSPVASGETRGGVNQIVEDHGGNIWVGTRTNGLVRMHGDQVASFKFADGLTDNKVLSLFEDREGSLWVGTAIGLDRFRNTKFLTSTTKEGLPSNSTKSAIRTADGSIFVFCEEAGVGWIKNHKVASLTKFPGLSAFIGAVTFESRDKSLWVGTVGGLTRIKDGQVSVYNSDPHLSKPYISAISEDDEGLIVATSARLVYRVKNGRTRPFTIHGQTTPLTLPGNYTFTIYRQHSGTLWFGTAKGLYKFADGESVGGARQTGIDFPVTSISDDGQGSLWLGGRMPGVARLNMKDGRIRRYMRSDGLFDDYLSRVLPDDGGNLWFSTTNDIYKARLSDLNELAEGKISKVQASVYGIADGMKTDEASDPTSQPAGTRGADGSLWFTTVNGIVSIDPHHIPQNTLVPPVVIESVMIDGLEMPTRNDLRFPPGKEELEIRYTALSLSIPERVTFKYRLEGYDREWIDAATRRAAYYTKLPPGRYRFRVIAANDDGVWNEAGASLTFTLLPHFYQTSWFYLLCGSILVAAAIVMYRAGVRRLNDRADELAKLVAERTLQLHESNRKLEEIAYLDHLTSLPNRRMFTDMFRKELALAQRQHSCFALLLVDLDHFKNVNDTLGHDAGDAVLVEAALGLRESVRESDCVARLGGDEFGILLVSARDEDGIKAICQRIMDRHEHAIAIKGTTLKIGASIGIARFPADGDTQEGLYRLADEALYEAKRAGRSSYRWALRQEDSR